MNRAPKSRQILIFLLSSCCGLLLSMVSPWLLTPSFATGTTLTAPVTLDGRPIFQVTDSTQFTAKERADLINTQLRSAVMSSDPLQVEVKERNDLPTLWVNERYLLTVTDDDVVPGRTPMEQATVWAEQLQQSVNQAQTERTVNYIQTQLLQAGIILLIMLVVHWGLGWLWFYCLGTVFQNRTETEEPSQRFDWLFNFSLGSTRLVIWIGCLIYITNLFPVTRRLSYRLQQTIISALTSPIITLGGRAYSVPNLLILGLFWWGLIFGVNTIMRLFRFRVLQVAGINRGVQEAIVVITKYALICIGSIVLLQIWGFDLSSLTILASAVGVGIGFGFQDIAKNFGSGLVLLFERPIQVGDFVEVGKYQGTVERLGARSTVIRTLDQVSIIVPNSRFLESELINWDHDNSVSGVRLSVGVAYGSDLLRVKETLLAAAHHHPDVLSIPAPQVLFRGFGDSSLDFELRVWLAQPSKQVLVKSDLYFQIDENFRQAQISIPFPQRDLWLRSDRFPLELSPEIQALMVKWLEQQVNEEPPLSPPS